VGRTPEELASIEAIFRPIGVLWQVIAPTLLHLGGSPAKSTEQKNWI